MKQLVQIRAKHFTAGIEIGGKTAPILSYMHGWSLEAIQAYCRKKGWNCELLTSGKA